MKEKQVTQYRCDYCDKKLYQKGSMVNHEAICSKNPENVRKCTSCNCRFLTKVHKAFYCDHPSNKRPNEGSQKMHTLTAIKRGLLERYPQKFELSILMPKECSLYEPPTDIIF